ncbi:hypothetical protein M404DRAFT_995806 [Pisolithus tinctorius Marx 270]|uniref:Uncharacterized protein n=1 Tax=Pisolithus tinctorius Marx 270 TaxID=870435 RepID=A0A0C3KJQ3_PISTI|nr:hypothetical protein M404DRAFT_995806 [Pisolithus tinctorius Marx 270]
MTHLQTRADACVLPLPPLNFRSNSLFLALFASFIRPKYDSVKCVGGAWEALGLAK